MMKTFLPLMQGHSHARKIINVSSVLGHYGLPYISTYSGSKFAIEGLSDSIRRELYKLNVQVIVLIPGAVKTRIFDKGTTDDYGFANGTVFEKSGANLRKEMLNREHHGISSHKVGIKVIKILKTRRPKPRYRITGSPIIEWYLPKYLPDWFLDCFLKWRLK